MLKIMKSVGLLLSVALVMMLLTSVAFASTGKDHSTMVKFGKTVITDKQEIKRIAQAQGIPLEYKGKQISRIEFEYIPSTNTGTTGGINIQSWDTYAYEIRNVIDYGHGWYNASDDLIHQFVVDGPDTFVINQTEEHSSEFSASFGATIEAIELGIGFKLNTKYSISMTSNTPVPAGQTLAVNIYKTFLKKSYDVWELNTFQSNKYVGTGYAYKPTGTYIQKTFY